MLVQDKVARFGAEAFHDVSKSDPRTLIALNSVSDGRCGNERQHRLRKRIRLLDIGEMGRFRRASPPS